MLNHARGTKLWNRSHYLSFKKWTIETFIGQITFRRLELKAHGPCTAARTAVIIWLLTGDAHSSQRPDSSKLSVVRLNGNESWFLELGSINHSSSLCSMWQECVADDEMFIRAASCERRNAVIRLPLALIFTWTAHVLSNLHFDMSKKSSMSRTSLAPPHFTLCQFWSFQGKRGGVMFVIIELNNFSPQALSTQTSKQ